MGYEGLIRHSTQNLTLEIKIFASWALCKKKIKIHAIALSHLVACEVGGMVLVCPMVACVH